MMPPCSAEEWDALESAAARLQDERYAVDVEEFAARPFPDPVAAAYAGLAAVAALLVYPAPLIAALLGGAAVVLHGRDSEGRPLLRQGACTSRNVVARAPGALRPALVVVAQAPAPAQRFSERTLRALVVALQVSMVCVAAAGAGAWIAEAGTELPRALAAGGIVAAAAIAVLAVLLHGPRREEQELQRIGADVLLQLAPDLRGDPVWLVATGGSATAGIAALLIAHEEVAGASWLNLVPAVTSGACAVSEEGTWRERRADRSLMGAAEEAGAEVRPYRAAPTAATALLARRRRALTLMVGSDPEGLRIALATARAALAEGER